MRLAYLDAISSVRQSIDWTNILEVPNITLVKLLHEEEKWKEKILFVWDTKLDADDLEKYFYISKPKINLTAIDFTQ